MGNEDRAEDGDHVVDAKVANEQVSSVDTEVNVPVCPAQQGTSENETNIVSISSKRVTRQYTTTFVLRLLSGLLLKLIWQ